MHLLDHSISTADGLGRISASVGGNEILTRAIVGQFRFGLLKTASIFRMPPGCAPLLSENDIVTFVD